MRSVSGFRNALYVLFALSGFSGLIYESIWSHYLKLFLGHAAYAQALVLMIFMGGMALGAWLVSRRSARSRQPLLAYSAVEAALGVAALVFDHVFRAMQALVFDTLIPQLDSPLAIDLVKWGLGGLIVLPQSVLLGATFPLISAGLVRLSPAAPGRALAWLYFTNSLGAAIGVLVSGYCLIPAAGLPGTIMTAGLINFVLAAGVWLLWRSPGPWRQAPAPAAARPPAAAAPALFLAAAFLTGAASFFYEIGWLRMLSLVLGSATHSFELMLAAFIFGLSAGSFYIRNRIERQAASLSLLGWIQVAMGSAAFLTIPLYGHTFDWMAALLEALQRNESGYVVFNLASQAICLALMLPVTFLAGTTLPLITDALLRNGSGEAAIGRVYAMNTLGSIAGVLAAVQLVMPLLGLRQVIVAGAAVDLALGLWLLARFGRIARPAAALTLTGCLLFAACVTAFVPFDPARTASGVYRFGVPRISAEILFHRDGKSATIDVTRDINGPMAILSNGKPDASTFVGGPPTADEYPQVLSAALPLMARPDARQVAVIGMGSGRTTHTLLLDPRVAQVETVEIERAMVEGARLFGEFSHLAFDDPRSRIHIEDAKTHFARSKRQYDLIVSEPSNPWVSGIASLFSIEFYGQIKRYLAPGGLMLQWLQLYEIDAPTMATALNALGSQFDDYVVYVADDWNILILASPHGAVPPLSAAVFADSGVAQALSRIDVHGLQDMRIRRLGGKASLAPFFRAIQRADNSDYFPVLDQLAVKTRFLGADAAPMLEIRRISRRLEDAGPYEAPISPLSNYASGVDEEQAEAIPEYLEWRAGRRSQRPYRLNTAAAAEVIALDSLDTSCDKGAMLYVWLPAFRKFAMHYLPFLSPQGAAVVAGELKSYKCYAGAPQPVRDWIDLFEADGARDWARARTLEAALLPTAADQASVDFLEQELLLADLRIGGPVAAHQRLREFPGINRESLPMVYLWALAAAK